MSDPFDFDGVRFSRDGYSVFPDYVPDPKRRVDSYSSPWEFWVAALARARRGDFSFVPPLLEVYNASEDPVLDRQCVSLLGDAGPAATVKQIRDSIPTALQHTDEYDPQFAADMAHVLFADLRLGNIPLLLSIYQDGIQFDETAIIVLYMESVLGEVALDGESGALQSDSQLVLDRVAALRQEYGTDEVRLWYGKPYSVPKFARLFLSTIDTISAPIMWRELFEAATGVDCRPFFNNDDFQPLTAAAMIEEFLDTAAADEFEEGVRYFFRHRIPD
jgi:hypothetical protein